MPSEKRRYQLLYFTFFASSNGFIVFRNVYFEDLGLTGGQMGILGALLVAAGVIAQPFWGAVADRFAASRTVLLVAGSVSAIAVLVYPIAGRLAAPFALLVAGTILLSVVRAPIVPITNAMVLSEGLNYGNARAFGSIAFGLGTLVIGWVLSYTATELVFYVYAAGMVVFLAIVWGIPEVDADADLTPDLRRDAVALLTDRRFVVLLVAAMLIGGVSAAGAAYFSVFVRAIGASDGLTGTAWLIKTIGEAAVFLWIARIDVAERTQLSLGAVLYVCTYAVYAVVGTPTAIVAVQLFLGVGLALYNLAVVNFAHEFAPAELTSTAQALLFSVGIGTGRAVGELSAGRLLDVVGVQSMYLYLAAGAAVAAVVSLYFHVPSLRRGDAAAPTGQ